MKAKSNRLFYAFIFLVIVLIFVLQYTLWFSNTGVIKYIALKQDVTMLKSKIKQKSQTNTELYSEVVSLRKDNEVLESLARQNFGLIKKGEVFYFAK